MSNDTQKPEPASSSALNSPWFVSYPLGALGLGLLLSALFGGPINMTAFGLGVIAIWSAVGIYANHRRIEAIERASLRNTQLILEVVKELPAKTHDQAGGPGQE